MDYTIFHAMILHFPIVLFWLGFIFDLLGLVFKFKVYPAGHWIIIGAALIAVPTALAGLEASQSFPGNPFIIIHRNWALATVTYGLMHGAFRFYALIKKKQVAPLIWTLLSIINVGLISMTAEYGGWVAFGKSLFK